MTQELNAFDFTPGGGKVQNYASSLFLMGRDKQTHKILFTLGNPLPCRQWTPREVFKSSV